MATLAHLRTDLKDRTVWFDGDSSFPAERLLDIVNMYEVKYVNELTDAVKAFNRNVAKSKELVVKTESRPITTDWNTPEEYKNLNVAQYLMEQHVKLTEGMDEDEIEQRDLRLITEISLFKKHGLFDVLRAIIWIINTLTANNIVWGVGRGSSVSSYALYVIGVHDVDSYAYELDISDFLHD